MKRRNVDSTKYYRKQFHFRKCKFDGIYGSNTFVYLKFLILWIFIMIADFVLEFRFEFIWPLWLFTRSLYESLKYQGIIFSIFFALIVFLFDLLCYIFLPVQWLFFAAGTYVWVQYIWHNDLNLKEKGVCLPTISLWLLFVYIETSFRLKNIKTIDLCRPFAAHSIGYPMVTLGFGFKSYVAYKYRIKKQKYVQKSNDFYVQLITKALPIDVKLKNSLIYEEEISPCNNIPAVQNSNGSGSKQAAYNNTISTTHNSKEKPMNLNNQPMKISSPSGLIASALSYYLNSTSSSNTNNNNNNSLEYFQYIQQKETTVAPKLLKQLNSSSSDLTYLKNQYKSKERNSDASYNDVNVNVSDEAVNFSSISIQSLAYEPNMTSNSGSTNFSKINNKGNHHQRSASSSSTQSQFSEKGTVPLTSTNHTNININMTINATAIAAAAAQAATTTSSQQQQTSSSQSSSSISRNSKCSRKNKESYREMSSTLSSSTLTNNNNSDSDPATSTVQDENLEKLGDSSSSTTEIDTNKSASNFDLVNRLEEDLKKMRIEIEQQKKVEQYLRTQINYITKCDRNEKLKLEKLQQENETLQSKISKMNIQKQKEKEELSAMEKRLQEEKQLRLALESQLSQEKQKRETSSSEQTIIEQNKRRIRELEMENSRLSNDCKCKQDRIEVEMKSLGKYREAESRANTLEVKLSVMQEKTASLQESLSAETRFKMDLFSALGEARRQLEYATFQLEARERELNTFKSIFKQSLMLNNQSGSENDIISQYLANQLNSLQSSLMNSQNNNSFNKIGNSTNETSNGNGNGEDAVNKKGLTK